MSKKILSLLVLGSLMAVLLVPVMVLAQEGPPEGCTMSHDVGISGCPSSGWVDASTTEKWGVCCLFNTIYGVTDLLFAILFALAILFFVYGGITMVMAAGDTEKFGKGKNYIMYALIGIVVALLAKAFPSIIKTVMGM